ncbi:serine hydrolase domain-containing protein [Gilvimarinus xylanilyticus]|uniref:Beta-lactamase family protein n=1 Tax=Gilvimarinus xylanilyticus TaxID=2944139 RepID=A0A9X2I158_9GAMM|nr:serine hydrolase domain-containing protein [Gilvimarinus xylanilyticus]MCP8898763.1 beta-lactamase family protein [Gilvimarinus xylanilyticus]
MIEVQGQWQDEAEPLVDAFRQNFAESAEQGAALAVYRHDKLIANLYAGTRDRAQRKLWAENTGVNIFSAGKPLVAAVIMRLYERGLLELDRPVGDYWPEFAARDKAAITTRQILNHTSGLSAFHPRVKDPVIFAWDSVRALLEYETPWWEPGSRQGYSPFLYGWLLANIACKVSGESDYTKLFQREVAEPLGLHAYCGVPDSLQPELADVGPLKRPLRELGSASRGANSAALGQLMKADPKGVTNRAFTNPLTLMNSTNSGEWRSACIPAANCHTDARSLARFYRALLSPGEWLSESTVKSFTQLSSEGEDAVLGVPLRFGLGFMLSRDVDDARFGGPQGFGHPGAGGSLGYADPETGIALGYVTARLGQSLLIDARAQRLIDALK